MTRKHINFFLLVVVFLIIASLFFVYKNQVYALFGKWKILPQSEKFTELYFTDHLSLPSRIVAGETFSFSFEIHNFEGKKMNYPYTAFIKSGSDLFYLDQDMVEINKDEYMTIKISYLPKKTIDNGIIQVRLTQLDQEIHFFLSN